MPDRRNKEISTASMKDSSRADGQLETDVNNSKHPKPGAADMETIASLSIHDQVDALAQALLREFMHRRGYTKTLQAFDRECPRNDRTIASRQLMRKLLEIPSPAFPSKLSGDNNSNSADFGGGGKDSAVMTNGGKEEEKENKKKKKKVPPTYMEELCSYRLQKRELQQRQKQATENNRKKKTGEEEGIEVEMIIDPSDAEMEKWRASAAERERCIQETRERHEELLQKRHEQKKRKKEKLKKRREEKRGKKEIDEDVNDFNRIAATSNASRSDRHGKHRVRFAVGDDDSNDEEVDLASANNSNSNNNNEDALAPVKSRNLEMCGGGGSGNVIAEPEFLLGRLDKRRSNRSAGTAVGSHWTPSGGGLAEVTGGSRGASFSPDPFTLTTSNSITTTSSTSSEKQPSFLLGEGMSLMSERMQATKKHSALDDWSSPSPSPFSTLRGSNNINNIISSMHGSSPASVGSDGTSGGLLVGARSMRGGAGFTPGAASGAWLKPHSAREGSLSGSFSCIPAPATAPHFSTAGQRVVSHGGGGPHSPYSPHTAADAFTIPPPPPSGILKTRAEGGRQGGYDGMARPTSSAMRQNSTGNTNNNSINNNNGVNGDAANGGGGGGREIEAKRKKRKVTILMD